MNCKTITERLKRVAAIVDSWKAEDGIPQIERDIALGELRDIYNAILVVDTEDIDAKEECDAEQSEKEVEVEFVIEAPTEEVIEAEEEEPIEESAPEQISNVEDITSIESFYNALDIDALLGLSDEPVVNEEPVVEVEPEPVAEEVVVEPEPEVEEKVEEIAVEPELVAESIVEPKAEESKPAEPKAELPKAVGAGLFDLNDIPVRSKSRRKMISLYSDNPIPVQTSHEPAKEEKSVEVVAPVVEEAPEVEAAPVVETTPVAEPIVSAPQRLGDSFGGVKTLADQMAKDGSPTTPFNRITELRQAIGLNDKFLMIRDLFGGDAARYEATIDTLDEFEDLDECIIYIVENFRWNPDSEAAKLLVSLIERKLA
ncbi:MAG: hypothetical protein IKW47_04225 [Alistipes sp.]|nr:hypothetical protein [Alistipes sp.]